MGLIEYSAETSTSKLRRRRKLIVVAAVLCALCWGGYRLTIKAMGAGAEDTSKMVFANAVVGNMDITIRHTGELSAVNDQEVRCQVDGANVIQDVIKEGTFVHKGDVVCTLDSSDIRQKLSTSTVDYQKAQSDVIWAKEEVAIQTSKNATDLEAATVELELAQMDLREYTEGVYPAAVKAAQNEEQMAEIGLKDKQTALAHTLVLLDKRFVTAEDKEKAEVDELTAKNDLEKKQTDLKVLQEFTHAKDQTDKKNKVAQAEQKVEHVKSENANNLNQKSADLAAKSKTLEVSKYQADHWQKQLDSCTMKAPGDGIMLYGPAGQSYYNPDRQIQAGGRVYQQQVIARLPDTTQIKVVVTLEESEITGIRADPKNKQYARVSVTGYDQPLWAWVSKIPPVADSARRWWDPDAREFPIDLTIDHTPPGLKPGATAEAEIFVKHLDHVLTIPLDSVYHSGADAYCFAMIDGRIVPTKVTVGESSRAAAQITQGLQEGQKVLLLGAGQGRELLDKAGIKPPPSTEPSPSSMPPSAPAVHAA